MHEIVFDLKGQQVEEHRSDLLFYMISIRMFPMTPNQILNLIFPHISNISTVHFVISVLVNTCV